MTPRATRLELAVFTLAALALSGAPMQMFTKLTGYAPPFPDFLIALPVFGLMAANVLIRLRSSVLGSLAAWPFVLFAGLACASYTWSIAPSETLREGFILLVTVPYLGMCAMIMDWRDIVSRMWWVGMGLVALSTVLYFVWPSFARMQDVYVGALSGVFFEKNASGQLGLFVALLTLALAAQRPARALPLMGVFIALLGFIALCQSATALACALVGAGVFGWVALMRRARPVSLPLFWVSAVIGVPVAILLMTRPEIAFDALGRSATLSGRIPIWQAVEAFAIPERPSRGFGYMAYWSDEFAYGNRAYVFDALEFEARHAHNLWIEARLGLGPAGMWLLAAAFVQAAMMSVLRMRRSHGAYLALPVLAAVTLLATVEISPITVSNWAGFLLLLVLAKMTLEPSAADARSGFAQFLASLSGAARQSGGRPATA